MKKNNKKEKLKLLLVILIVLIGIGYAAIRTGLNINGTANVSSSSWDIHFENYQVTTNSTVTPSTAPSTPSGEKPTTVSYEVTLINPGDTYEFTLDVVNGGTLDAMIESFSSKLDGVEINNDLPAYLEYSVAYDDGTALQNKQKLAHNTTEKLKLRVKYRTDIETTDLPGVAQDLTFSFTIIYIQDDGTSIPVRIDISNASWDEIIDAVENNQTTQLQADMNSGTTRVVPLDLNQDGESDSTCNLRIANLSTPAECATEGFSQTACGLVLECANVITTHVMNSSSTNAGGWPASEMRTYLNDETENAQSIYNALPEELRSKVIPTYVVSGHQPQVSTNYISTDKIYLFSPKEVGFDASTDSAKAETRILDYYAANNTNVIRIKKILYNNRSYEWWLRTVPSDLHMIFFNITYRGDLNGDIADGSDGVSPAFRIGRTS